MMMSVRRITCAAMGAAITAAALTHLQATLPPDAPQIREALAEKP